MIDISVIIVNYKTQVMTGECIDAVLASKGVKLEVIVVDNLSGDGSVEYFKKKYKNITVIANDKNAGFADANNKGAAVATGEFVWLLNSDTIIEPHTIEKLLDLARENKSMIASCKLLNRDGSLQPQGGSLPNVLNLTTWMLKLNTIPYVAKLIPPYQDRREQSFLGSKPKKFGWLGGTAFLVRRDLYQAMQGLDDHIFMYGEDVEFCLRAGKQNIAIDYFASPQLIHLGQQSGSKPLSLIGEFKGLKYVFNKHHSRSAYLYVRFILKVGALLRMITYALKGDKELVSTYAKAFNVA